MIVVEGGKIESFSFLLTRDELDPTVKQNQAIRKVASNDIIIYCWQSVGSIREQPQLLKPAT
ncbi:hypothetical protein PROFUN_08189 [Planoprotostelium fungivorum]|uniref:Uncharacterized protein n=1 Tax=Planoprotostelium fungivorum TaxID=1890364 RepID=A0A2P6N654_9EUKA|nr:hypothetical protein PROFUN_08189 [Planoprotostelium fungivorum]